ncbi:MAG: Dabb family protein [Acidobacteriota bacterium]|nr:Dabb family protein [Acidobacteriota bacterium]
MPGEIMLVHIVAWKYKAETGEEIRKEHRSKLRALPDQISDIISFDVGADILKLDRSYDTGLVARYSDRAAFDSYTVHPAHRAVAGMGKEIAENVVSVDFIIE